MPKQKPGRSKQNYATPPEFINAVKRRLGVRNFGWDFAADDTNTKAASFWSLSDNALRQDWTSCLLDHEWGWLNPPFANIGPWVVKCLTAGRQIAFLVPASVGSNWFRDFIHQQYGVEVLFLNGRICFNGVAGYPKDCMLVLFGTNKSYRSDVWTWEKP